MRSETSALGVRSETSALGLKKISLALWGWGAKWLSHIWVLKYLEEKEIKIEEISGTSMWAVIGAMIAIWINAKEIEDFAKSISVLKLTDFDLKSGLLKWKKVEKKLREVFWDKKIEETIVPLKIVATNIEKAETKVFTSWKITDAIRASLSLPWIFVPKEIAWELYVDWWIMMNLPIEVLDWKNILAVSVLKIGTWKIIQEKEFLWVKFKTWFWKNNYEIIKRSVVLMMKVNEDNSLKTTNKNIILIKPNFWKLDLMDFGKVDEFVKVWYLAIKNILK